MSDEHHEHDGGHELEALDAGQLFRIVGGLAIVVLISIIAVIQWFHKQQEELRITRSDYTFLQEHRDKEAEMLEGIDAVAAKVADDPSMLAAPPAPEGWVHPDDVKSGGAPAMGGTPADGAPADGDGDGAAPDDGTPADAGEGDAAGDDAAAENGTAEGSEATDADDASDDEVDGSKPAGDEKSAPSEEPADEDSADKSDKAADE